MLILVPLLIVMLLITFVNVEKFHVVLSTGTSTCLKHLNSTGVILSGSMETIWYEDRNLSNHTPNLCAYPEIFIPEKGLLG